MIKAIFLRDVYLGLEKIAEHRFGKKLCFGIIANDLPFSQKKNPIYFRNNVGDVMGDEKNAGPLLRELSQEIAQFTLSTEIERIGRFIQQQHLG